jgi:hypothetical protein
MTLVIHSNTPSSVCVIKDDPEDPVKSPNLLLPRVALAIELSS